MTEQIRLALRNLAFCWALLFVVAGLLSAESPEGEKSRSDNKFAENNQSGPATPALSVNAQGASDRSKKADFGAAGPMGLRLVRVRNGPSGIIDDVSRLNPTPIDSLRFPRTEADIRDALEYARRNHLGVSAAGARHSQGGQIVYDGNVVLDMAQFKQMSIDKEKKILTVQSGARWNDIQRLLDANGLSLDVVQTHNFFSVGGSLSVNGHGSNPNSGPLASTVQSLRVMLADGRVINASREENSEIFRAALGGYGMIGVILEARLQLRDDELYSIETEMVKVKDYPEYFSKNIRGDGRIKYLHALLSTSPNTFLREIFVVKYVDAMKKDSMDSPLIERIKRKIFGRMFFLAKTKIGQIVFWDLTTRLVPKIAGFMKFSRNQAMAEPLIAFRSSDPRETQILHEYFVPPGRFPEFVERAREIILRHRATLTMAAARGVAADADSMLAYAPEERMALVMFFNQKIDPAENTNMAVMTRELINAAIDLGGRFYLPYQLVYSDKQLHQAYPNIEEFFKLKRKYDPNELFMNKWYAKYGKSGTP